MFISTVQEFLARTVGKEALVRRSSNLLFRQFSRKFVKYQEMLRCPQLSTPNFDHLII